MITDQHTFILFECHIISTSKAYLFLINIPTSISKLENLMKPEQFISFCTFYGEFIKYVQCFTQNTSYNTKK